MMRVTNAIRNASGRLFAKRTEDARARFTINALAVSEADVSKSPHDEKQSVHHHFYVLYASHIKKTLQYCIGTAHE
jgi:hypothetical protein